MVPHGFRFNPTDEELIQLLDRKASDQEMPLNFILYTNLYDHEPQNLEWKHNPSLGNDERYYYCRRENDSREVAGKGWWKATSHVKKVHVNELLVGYKRPLTFHRYRDHYRNRNNAIKTNWIMHEYSLQSRTTEWRLCKIKYKGKPSIQEEMENLIMGKHNSEEAAGSSAVNAQLSSDRVRGQQQEQEEEQHSSSSLSAENCTLMPTYNNQDYNWNLPQTPYAYPYHQNLENNGYDSNELPLEPNVEEQCFGGSSSLWSWQI